MAKRTWVVIADGAHARLFQNEGPGTGLRRCPSLEREKDLEPTREIMTDRPGRVHDRFGPGRHAMAPRIDFHRQEKDLFARELAELLNAAAKDGSYDSLVLVAPPQALGDLRRHLDGHAGGRIAAEIQKDLVKTSEQELPKHLGDAIKL